MRIQIIKRQLLLAMAVASLVSASAATAIAAEAPSSAIKFEGTVATSAGEPIADAPVRLTRVEAAEDRQQPHRRRVVAHTRTDEDGRFSFTNLAPGDYQLQARSNVGRAMLHVTLEEGQSLDLPVTLQPARRASRDGQINTPPARGERHTTQLRVGDAAPDFALPTADLDDEITLSSFRGHKPVVLVFGSYTCPPFRDRVLRVNELAQIYGNRAQFLMVYIREAHPESVLRMQEEPEGERVLRTISQTFDLVARSENARLCVTNLEISFPAVVDREDNKVNAAYAGWPARIVVVDQRGKVALDSGPGPAGFQPQQLEQWLKANLERPVPNE